MTPLLTVILLAGTLLPQAEIRNDSLSNFDIRQSSIEVLEWFEFAQDLGHPEVIYFDAPPRPYKSVIRR